ncbi:MAG TPA: tetratricopeptide repeat protein [Verrucomicrobiae bacterium]|nr:tetratricopeptide repeat protein [Verrucomicrobiae bacterium]
MAEKTSRDISRDVRLRFEKGMDALLRENTDYAVDLLNQVLEKEPALYEARKALRTAQAKKSGGGGFFKKAWSGAASTPLIAKGQVALRTNPADALVIAEQILNNDPTNSSAHRIIVEAATALELPRTAVLSLEILSKNSPKDKAIAIQYANALADIGETSRAEKVLTDFSRNATPDGEILHALKNVSARKTLREGGYDALAAGEGSYRDILKNAAEAVSLEQENRMQKTEDVAERLIAEYEERLKTDPGNLKLLRSVAELYTQKKQFERALKYYDQIKATDAGGSDATLDRAISETKVRRYEFEIQNLDKSAPDYEEKAAKLNAEKLRFQIADCQQRVEKFPTDLSIRFEMGSLYFQAGKISEAIQEFQKAQGNPHKRIAAMNFLAQCFARRKMYDIAARTLQNALKEKLVFDDEKKELIYNLGCVLDSMGKKDEAVEQFKQIYEMDIGYRDIAAKVDAYYAGQ